MLPMPQGTRPPDRKLRRLGIFGGAFDPPHQAHVALVTAAMAQLALDQVRVLPTGQAWHKPRELSPAVHRLAMARLAYQDLPQVWVDDREIQRPGPSYTLDTLRELQSEFPAAQLYLLLGDDQRRALPSWRGIGEITRIAIICAAGRDAAVRAWNQAPDAPAGPPPLPDALSARTLSLDMPLMPHSATDIRLLAAAQQTLTGLVPPAVERYIHDHHLYRPH
jgi:nicotinate-nucleotide adenylyltransferase